MSKLGPNQAKKYFSNTEEVYELYKIILNELYSKEISDLAIDLLMNGKSTIYEIQSRLKLSFENIKNYLIIMLQNNLIQKKQINRSEGKYISYEIKQDQILNILFFPRSLNFIEKKYGENARLIFEQFIEFGVLTLKQIIEQIQNIQKNGNNLDLIKANILDIFIKLYSDNLICYAERPSEEDSSSLNYNNLLDQKKRKREKSEKAEKANNKLSDKKKSGKKKKGKKEESEDNNSQPIKSKNMKLIEDDEDNDNIQESKEISNKNEEFYENNTKNNMHFYINFSQINLEFQTEIILDFINNNLSHQAALLAGILLKNYKISSFTLGITQPKNIDDLVKENKSLTLNQIEDIIKNYDEYFNKSNTDNIYLNLNAIKKFIKSKVIQSIIISKFSKEHFRIYNLLNLVGSLDQKNIMDLCLIGPKKINYIINQLFQEGFIKTDTVNFNGNNMLFYSVDDYQTTEKILEIDYKIINNYNFYYYDQMKNIKNKFIDNKKKNEEMIKLTYIIDQICENILIMKYF